MEAETQRETIEAADGYCFECGKHESTLGPLRDRLEFTLTNYDTTLKPRGPRVNALLNFCTFECLERWVSRVKTIFEHVAGPVDCSVWPEVIDDGE